MRISEYGIKTIKEKIHFISGIVNSRCGCGHCIQHKGEFRKELKALKSDLKIIEQAKEDVVLLDKIVEDLEEDKRIHTIGKPELELHKSQYLSGVNSAIRIVLDHKK